MQTSFRQILLLCPSAVPWAEPLLDQSLAPVDTPASVASSLSQSPSLAVLNLLAVQQRPEGALGPVRTTQPTLVPRGWDAVHLWDWTSPPEQSS